MNEKERVIGINLKYLNFACVASLISVVLLFLPYVTVNGETTLYIGLFMKVLSGDTAGASWLLILTIIATIIVAVMGVLNFRKPSPTTIKVWAGIQAINTAATTVLLFASKSILNNMYADGFMVKNFSWGYWLSLICSYVALVFIMKTAKINVGYIVLAILSIIWLFPIVWILLTSFREEQGFYVPYFIPKGFTFDNYIKLFTNESVLPFGRWYLNTLIVAACACVINTLIVLATSFVLSRTRFKGRKMFMNILMVIGMFPGFMTMIAVYNILKGLGLNQSIWALVLLGAAGAAMGYHVCKGFFDTVPKAMDEAATIDGATKWQIFIHITIPLSKSIIVYTVLCNFLGAWSDYIFPSILFGDKQENYTVAVGLHWMTDFRRINTYYTQFAAGAVVVALPIVILFVWLQRYYVEGLSGSVKG